MSRYKSLLFLLYLIIPCSVIFGNHLTGPEIGGNGTTSPDSLERDQVLFNGRVWRNLYTRIIGNQFLFSADFLQGSVTMNGTKFQGLYLLYDIHDDEILTPGSDNTILRLNKEMVDSFSLIYQMKEYRFTKIAVDTAKGDFEYVNILYSGKTALYIKYNKLIALLEVDDKYDKFYEVSRIYFIKNGEIHPVKFKRDLLKNMEDHKVQVKNFIRKNNIVITKKNPDAYIPVVRYYDSLDN